MHDVSNRCIVAVEMMRSWEPHDANAPRLFGELCGTVAAAEDRHVQAARHQPLGKGLDEPFHPADARVVVG